MFRLTAGKIRVLDHPAEAAILEKRQMIDDIFSRQCIELLVIFVIQSRLGGLRLREIGLSLLEFRLDGLPQPALSRSDAANRRSGR